MFLIKKNNYLIKRSANNVSGNWKLQQVEIYFQGNVRFSSFKHVNNNCKNYM